MYKPLIAMLAFFFLGNGFYYIGEASFNGKSYSSEVAVVGRITDDIVVYDYSMSVVIDDVRIDGEESKNVRVFINNCYSELNVGEYVTFETRPEKSKPFYLREFNSRDYRTGVRYNCMVDYEDIVFSSGGKKVDETIRLDIKELIYSNMSEENASIAYAVMFGDKSDLDYEIYTSYQNSGIIHVLTVSGLHVGFLVSLFYGLLKRCKVNKIVNCCISSVIILLYAYLCNFSPSVVRAGIMAICFMLSKALHKKYDSLNALGLAGFILCIFKPLTALDIGFLMSFFCVFAIIMINPVLTRFFAIFLPDKIASLIALSTSAQLGVLPFIAYMGGSINLLSFMINIIVVPLFSVLYPFLFVVSMLGAMMSFWGVLLQAVNFMLTIISKIATFFGHAGLVIPLSEMGFGLVLVFFLMLFLTGRYFMIEPVKKFAGFTLSFLVFVFVFCCYALPINQNKKSTVSYLNSYGETCVVLKSKRGETFVVGDNRLLEKYKNKYQNTGFHVYLGYDRKSNEEIDDLTELGFFRFITTSSISDEGGGMEEVLTNITYNLSDFSFTYLEYDDEILGVVVNFDNQTIFVAKEGNLGYNLIASVINSYQPVVVIANENTVLPEGNHIAITYKEVGGCDYSYQNEGNIQLTFNGNSWVKRGLD